MFVSEEEPCPSRGSLLTATVCTLQRGIPRQASSGNCFPTGLAPPLHAQGLALLWDPQPLAAPADLCTSLPLLMPWSPSNAF